MEDPLVCINIHYYTDMAKDYSQSDFSEMHDSRALKWVSVQFHTLFACLWIFIWTSYSLITTISPLNYIYSPNSPASLSSQVLKWSICRCMSRTRSANSSSWNLWWNISNSFPSGAKWGESYKPFHDSYISLGIKTHTMP